MPSIEEQYMRAVEGFRKQKDDFFRDAPESPILEEERATFEGLRYFPAIFALRVIATVEPYPEQKEVMIATSDSQTRVFGRYAALKFTVGGEELTLTGYRGEGHVHDDGEEHFSLFVPFRDALAGTQTYGAGRYLDVEEEVGDDGKPIVVLDFNLAYNPYCAYNEDYSCPLTPAENNLTLAIRAGERVYHDEPA